MKWNYFVLMLAITAGTVTGCTRSNSMQTQPLNSHILPGTWELRGITGGQRIPSPDDYKPGNGHLWKFTANHFEYQIHDSVYNSGSYTVAHTGVDLNTNRTIEQFIFNGAPAESFELKDDTLHIYYGFIPADRVINHYVKITDG